MHVEPQTTPAYYFGRGSKRFVSFYEPDNSICSWWVNSFFNELVKPQIAAIWITGLSMLITYAVITEKQENALNCPPITQYNEWQPSEVPVSSVDSGWGEVKEFTRVSTNGNFSINNECIYSNFKTPYIQTLYTVIQSTMIFMLVMTLNSGLNKYREEIRLFEALAGDIKAMAMLIVHITYDNQKFNTNTLDNTITLKPAVKSQFDKIKILLAVLAPTARMVLKGEERQNENGKVINRSNARVENLETRKNYRKVYSYEPVFFPLSFFSYNFKCCGRRMKNDCNYCSMTCNGCRGVKYWPCCRRYKRVPMPWAKYESWKALYDMYTKQSNPKLSEFLKLKRAKKLLCTLGFEGIKNVNKEKGDVLQQMIQDYIDVKPTEVEFNMYERIKKFHEETGLDLFETVMTIMLDEISKMSEKKLGLGNDEASAVMNHIYKKWEAIYASWGTMSSIKNFSEPPLVHFYRTAMLVGYACIMPFSYTTLIRYEESDISYIQWCYILVFCDILVFAFMWWLAYVIRNPFEDVRCMNGVKPISIETQKQVVYLIDRQETYEQEIKENIDFYKPPETTDQLLKRLLEPEKKMKPRKRRRQVSTNRNLFF